MGSVPAVSYANIFMSEKIDSEIIRIANTMKDQAATERARQGSDDNEVGKDEDNAEGTTAENNDDIIKILTQFLDDILQDLCTL